MCIRPSDALVGGELEPRHPPGDPRGVAGLRPPHVVDEVLQEEPEGQGRTHGQRWRGLPAGSPRHPLPSALIARPPQARVVRVRGGEVVVGALLGRALPQPRRDVRPLPAAPDVAARLRERRGEGAVRRRVVGLRRVGLFFLKTF